MPITTVTTPAATEMPAAPLSARERAIAKMMEGATPNQEQTLPVQNASKVSPEEMSAVTGTSPETKTENPTNEEATPAEAKPKDEPLSAQYAQLARKEKSLRLEMQKLKQEREAFKAEREAAKAPAQPQFDPSKYVSKEQLQKDAWSVLNDSGITYDQLTEQAMNQPSPEIIQTRQMVAQLQAEIKALREGQDATKASIQEQQTQSYQQAVNQIRNDARNLVASDPDAYEAIKTTNSVDDVVDLIEKTFKEDGILMTVQEAAKAVEEYLSEEAFKLTQLKKIQQRLKPAGTPAGTTPQQKEASGTQKQPSKTLTNAVGTTRQLTARERALMAAQHGASWREKV